MSKINAMRALREARYAERNGPGAQPSTRQAAVRFPLTPGEKPAAPRARTSTSTTSATPAATPVADAAADAVTEPEELCGHRTMGGKSCTREAGHEAKSHRYS